MVESNALDGRVVNLLIDNFEGINRIRENSQAEAAKLYDDFMLVVESDSASDMNIEIES